MYMRLPSSPLTRISAKLTLPFERNSSQIVIMKTPPKGESIIFKPATVPKGMKNAVFCHSGIYIVDQHIGTDSPVLDASKNPNRQHPAIANVVEDSILPIHSNFAKLPFLPHCQRLEMVTLLRENGFHNSTPRRVCI
jgi:hypothetical protein